MKAVAASCLTSVIVALATFASSASAGEIHEGISYGPEDGLLVMTTTSADAAEPSSPGERSVPGTLPIHQDPLTTEQQPAAAGQHKSPLIPMAAMTGKPTRELIRHRLRQYAAVGVRQFLVYPRSGCELPYMSEQWLEACRNVVECADELDIDVWLYDEFNWPSGRCDGQVMDGHPEFCAKTLVGTKTEHGMTWEVTSNPKNADLLSPDAMRRFMALTHERYAERFGDYLGRRVKGVFTDEPSFKYGRPQKGNGKRLELPYYNGIEEDYTKATGRELRDDLGQAMHGRPVEGLWPTFYRLLGQQFQTAFFTPIRKWCDRHGMVSTGHLMSEVPPVSSVKSSGTPLAALRDLSLPGMDEINTRVSFDRAEWGTLLLERHATTRNGRGGLAELFAIGPADMPFGKLRQMIWLTALHGVSEYVLAVSPLDARGNLIKRDYFTAFTPVQTWFDQLPLLAEESTRAAEVACTGFGPGVVIHYPWSLACEDAGRDMIGQKAQYRSGEFYKVAKTLIGDQWPVRLFDEGEVVPEDALATVTITAKAIRLAIPGGEKVEVQSPDEITTWLGKHAQRPYQVSGNLAPGNVLAEHLADGRICVLNLTDRDLAGLTLQTPSSTARFDLPARGVRLFDQTARTRDDAAATREPAPEPRFRVQLDRPNLLRCRFKSAADAYSFSFECEEAVSGRLVVRAPDQLQSVRLDGRDILLTGACTDLPEGLREFYKTSEALQLAPGTHRVELTGKVDDAPFLPAAFLAGDFGVFEGDVLRPLPTTAGCEDLRDRGLRNYAGRVTLTTRLSVPNRPKAISLRLATGEHIAEVVMDGRSLGTRGWAPFEWQIPDELRGKQVSVEIILTPSIGAMFDRPAAVDGGSSWLKGFWPGQHAALGVLAAPTWCFRDVSNSE